MKIKIKMSKATILKIAGIALGIAGTMVDSAERKIEIQDAVNEYMKENSKTVTTIAI